MLEDAHIERIVAGDRAAFRQLHEAFFKRLYLYVFSLTRDKEVAEDILQEAFVLYWEKRENYHDVLSVRAFLYSVIRNKAMRLQRDESIHRRILSELHWEESTPEEHVMMAAEIVGQIRQAVEMLPLRTRRVIQLAMNDLKVEEIAAEMQISPNTVKMLKKAGYRALREQLEYLRSFLFCMGL